MTKRTLALLAPAAALLLSGCLSTAGKIITAPVRVAGSAVDAVTTSQSEADEKRGRELRKREEKLGKMQRQYDKHLRQCDRGDQQACDKARNDYADMQYLRR
ncbi:MAG: hypothetical protein K0R64_742 [Novosphingobium lindaniclasticum]|jgi:hypothetical protein|uniref:Lipoprotein n=1 Tax=Novosphingobium lindaniclasticum LE124 TaxID=1096930 RepID=T0H8B6_9SPHN|nr:DUF6726 family protein [Novosphingobium lindaniclasticum]EQB12601.1 hypothetical protein L284_15210 [Novosphingobium lindaniclasticum LE124]MDF2637758.1 hypothetical protein [Novosphingobium lindaniclasticum]